MKDSDGIKILMVLFADIQLSAAIVQFDTSPASVAGRSLPGLCHMRLGAELCRTAPAESGS